MKEVLIIASLMILCLFNIAAQQSTNNLSFVIGAGINKLSTYQDSHINVYRFGVYKSSALNENINLNSGLFINSKGGDSSNSFSQFAYTFHQISMPVVLEYSPDFAKKLLLTGGLYGGYNFKKRLKYKTDIFVLSNSSITNNLDYEPIDEFNNIEWGFRAGIGYKIANSWSIHLKASFSGSFIYDRNNKYNLLLLKDQGFIGIPIEQRIGLDNSLQKARNINFLIEIHKSLF